MFVSLDGVRLAYPSDYGEVLALDGLTMGIEEGEFAAVVGPSGCGKSSLMRLATGLHLPQSGAIRVADKPVTGPLSITGMAFQNPSLLPWRTTLANVMLPLEIVRPHRRRLKHERTAYTQKAEDLLSLVGLEGFGARFPWQLSGGMQQRANLCRALIHDPVLLMLDEPFGALDAFTREELWAVMQDLHAQKRFTVILVTHDLREAIYLADKIFVMSARPGRIISEHRVPFPRPRPMDITYEREFVDLVQELRGEIADARKEVA
ncbi:ABC transporter ATP-binding protein [Acuticoccus mangrovi]|uniref:ABC transporter ATP-binding protein n=1 Tax=Acuticoccus mangrovi TaxID=2796142 RepID=A0A934MKF2_9HYPH|nr:ABC transporter ATP-binding protein [Acuticoccus mangrovi]MBJ3775409.1 ABC transporter ATP-binding protein [Acuticoccus mangrovi]